MVRDRAGPDASRWKDDTKFVSVLGGKRGRLGHQGIRGTERTNNVTDYMMVVCRGSKSIVGRSTGESIKSLGSNPFVYFDYLSNRGTVLNQVVE